MQMHHHRSEHWVVVHGTAKVTIGNEEKLVRENEFVYISPRNGTALENPGKTPLEMIEVQIGSYLGEDDIVRTDDVYNRAPRRPSSGFLLPVLEQAAGLTSIVQQTPVRRPVADC